MVGISGFGAYVPRYRLSRQVIASNWGGRGGPGERSVANHDEDSLTMAVEASINAIGGRDPSSIDGAYFASTTPPYLEKQASTILATVLDMRSDIRTADFSDSLRAGTSALLAAVDSVKSGELKNVIVSSADCRLGEPETAAEMNFGDAAASVIISDSDVVVEIIDTYSLSEEIAGTWRREDDDYVQTFAAAFEAKVSYAGILGKALKAAFKKFGIEAKDISRAVIPTPNMKSPAGIAKKLGLDPKTQMADAFFATVGDAGCPQSLLTLNGVLEDAKPGDKILLVSYGDGADVILLEVKDGIEKLQARRGVKSYIETKRDMKSYGMYTRFKGTIKVPDFEQESSAIAMFREKKQNYSFYGVKCTSCGTVQFPIQRVCMECREKDKMEEVKLQRQGNLFTFTNDFLAPTADPPVTQSVVDLEGGGRIFCQMTDSDAEKVQIDMPVEMVLRRLHDGSGFHNYFWKCRPV